MVIAMSLSAMLLAIAVPRFAGLRGPYVLRHSAGQISAEFARARMQAIASNSRVRLTYTPATRTYTLEREVGAGLWTRVYANQLPTGVSITFPVLTPIFDTRGMLNQNTTIPVSVQGYSHSRTVTINVLGNVTIS
jgi:Tfp pilus assembly protein FimT